MVKKEIVTTRLNKYEKEELLRVADKNNVTVSELTRELICKHILEDKLTEINKNTKSL